MHDISKEKPKVKLYVQQSLVVFSFFILSHHSFCFLPQIKCFSAIIEFIELEKLSFVRI